jgi:DNA-binding response OmpR family regulator
MSENCPCCQQPLPLSDLIIDEAGFVLRRGRFAALTQQEFAVFQELHTAGHRVRSRQALLQSLYQLDADEPNIQIIDVFVSKLRKKLKPLGVEIQTVWGRGYRLLPVVTESEGK